MSGNTSRPRRHMRVLTILVALLLPSLVLANRDNEVVTPDDGWAGVASALETLWSGTPEERLSVAGEADLTFAPLSYREHDPDQPAIDRAVESLRHIIRIEEDDWIASRLLDHLGRVDVDNLRPLFRDALRSRSVNVARVAIRWYGEHPDPDVLPDLEDAWVRQPRAWVRTTMFRLRQELKLCIEGKRGAARG